MLLAVNWLKRAGAEEKQNAINNKSTIIVIRDPSPYDDPRLRGGHLPDTLASSSPPYGTDAAVAINRNRSGNIY